MIYSNIVQVLDESQPRMTQENLYRFSHSLNGYSFYDLVIDEKSDSKDMEFIEDTLTRQGIPCIIYPDRVLDDVIIIRFNKEGVLSRVVIPYGRILYYPEIIDSISRTGDWSESLVISQMINWENQVQQGNVFSLKQFIKPSE